MVGRDRWRSFVALISPVDRLGEQLATAHMVQHLLLADVVPILFTLALTKWILRPVTRHVHRIERAAGPFGHPAFGVVAYVGAMWLWHVPALYNAALEHGAIHVLEHLSFAAAGLLYWWHLLSPIRSRMRLGRDRADPLHGLDEDPRRLPRDPADVLLDASSTTSTRPAGRAGGCRALDDQHVAGPRRWRSSSRW